MDLVEQNLTIISGRFLDYLNIYGFGCNNIASFYVVTLSGAILTITSNLFLDFCCALCGRENYLGIVTKFTIETVPKN